MASVLNLFLCDAYSVRDELVNDHFTNNAGRTAETLKAPIMQSSSDEVHVRADVGRGRVFMLLAEERDLESAERVFHSMTANSTSNDAYEATNSSRIVLALCSEITTENFERFGSSVISLLQKLSVRQASFVGIGAASAVVQHLALQDLKIVRALVLVDAVTRPHPSRWERALSSLEARLPLGLPFRSSIEGFDSRPFLQRIRCPVLVLTTPEAGAFIQSESLVFEEKLPTAWRHSLRQGDDIAEIIINFQEVPAKCPQKARRSGN